MKKLARCLLLIGLPAFAADPNTPPAPSETPATPAAPAEAWPQKGDTVYLSAKLEWMHLPLQGPGPRQREELFPCTPLTVLKRKDDPFVLRTRDDASRLLKFLGDSWTTRLHRSESSCAEFLGEHGPPRVQSRDGVMSTLMGIIETNFEIVSSATAAEAGTVGVASEAHN